LRLYRALLRVEQIDAIISRSLMSESNRLDQGQHVCVLIGAYMPGDILNRNEE